MDWKSVGEQIVQDDQNKWDRKASAKELHVSETGALKVLNRHVEIPEYGAFSFRVRYCAPPDESISLY